MSEGNSQVDQYIKRQYEAGFITDIESESLPLPERRRHSFYLGPQNEPEFLLNWRLNAYREWLKMEEPNWAHVHFPKIDYNDISYYSAPKSRKDGPKSLDEGRSGTLKTYENWGPPTACSTCRCGGRCRGLTVCPLPPPLNPNWPKRA